MKVDIKKTFLVDSQCQAIVKPGIYTANEERGGGLRTAHVVLTQDDKKYRVDEFDFRTGLRVDWITEIHETDGEDDSKSYLFGKGDR